MDGAGVVEGEGGGKAGKRREGKRRLGKRRQRTGQGLSRHVAPCRVIACAANSRHTGRAALVFSFAASLSFVIPDNDAFSLCFACHRQAFFK